MLKCHVDPNEPLPFEGSVLLVTGTSLDQVREDLMNDPYAKQKVWDMNQVRNTLRIEAECLRYRLSPSKQPYHKARKSS